MVTGGVREGAVDSLGMCVSCFGEPYRFWMTAVSKIFMYVCIFIELPFAKILISRRVAWKSKYFKGAKGFFFFLLAPPRLTCSLCGLAPTPRRKDAPQLRAARQRRSNVASNPWMWCEDSSPHHSPTNQTLPKGARPAANQCPTDNNETLQGWNKKRKRKKQNKTESSSLRAVSCRLWL